MYLRSNHAPCVALAARRAAATLAELNHCHVMSVIELRSDRAWHGDARGSIETRKLMETKDVAQARIATTNAIVEYMHGDGSTTPRDTLGHAAAIAQVLADAGLLINPRFQVAISPQRLNELKHAEVTLGALEAGGVDSWEGYDDSISALHKDDVVE